MRVLPFLFVVFLLTSVLAVPFPSSELDDDREQASHLLSDWSIHTVDSNGRVGEYTSIALDSNDYPHISYFDFDPNYTLKYAKWNGFDWSTETVDSLNHDVGRWTSIALDSNDHPHISYEDCYNRDLKYATWNGSVWSIYTVDSLVSVGSASSLALDSNDHPHISYFNWTYGSLGYARWTGSKWSIETVDSSGDVGGYTSTALDSNDYPHISYFDTSNDDLKYADWNGSAWNTTTVDSNESVGWWSSLALDGDERPHISYYDFTNSDLKYASWDGSTWNLESVDSKGYVGGYTSIALDNSGYPHISYYDYDYSDLKYARWNGSKWEIETPHAAYRYVGRWTSIAIDTDDNPHVSYHNGMYRDLMYATKAELGPVPEPLLSYSPSSVDFGTLPSNVTDDRSFEVWNSGNGTLTYSITENIPWADVYPLNGSSTGEHDTINVTVNTGNLSEGLHEGSISITSNGGDGTVNVSVVVLAPSRTISLDIDPDTLNLKSMGRWITAYLSAENASVYDIDISSILLQDTLALERWDYQDDVLMLKFNRQDLIAILEVGESVEIKLSGKWKDGTAFEAYDYIRVINPEKK